MCRSRSFECQQALPTRHITEPLELLQYALDLDFPFRSGLTSNRLDNMHYCSAWMSSRSVFPTIPGAHLSHPLRDDFSDPAKDEYDYHDIGIDSRRLLDNTIYTPSNMAVQRTTVHQTRRPGYRLSSGEVLIAPSDLTRLEVHITDQERGRNKVIRAAVAGETEVQELVQRLVPNANEKDVRVKVKVRGSYVEPNPRHQSC
ncbi:hypothetical protein BCR34DRAFT_588990 [Clohesyomyces aquaticus]|uniref:Uncharacterized protein n=1 Tax=Clohesyomyces aquaticus TaxID=1231657 RepID=A0A1Y1ZI32_9PLEO|nr:hypothetical protein BCR34DRAFT_588990 [Clohesyomyces aquaticus]